jgi:hypothetical protein
MKNNPVAKNAHKFNKAQVHKDRKKAQKKGERKHKGSYESVDEVLKVSDGAAAWIKDFQQSDAPQFKGKSMDKRKEMALAAYLDAKKGSKEESMNEKSKGLWHNIHQKRKRGEAPAKPGDKDYPKTLDIESKNTPGDGNPCWDTHKKVGTKMKNGKRVNDCVPKNESAQDRLDRMAKKHGLGKPNKAADDYLAKMMKKYGAKDMADLKKKMGMKESRLGGPKFKYAVYDKKGNLIGAANDDKSADKMAREVKGRVHVLATPTRQPDIPKTTKEGLQELTAKDIERIAQSKAKRTGTAPKKTKASSGGYVSSSDEDNALVMQLRKAQDMRGKTDVKFQGGKTKLPPQMIDKLLDTYDRLKTPADKKKFVTLVTHELRKMSGLAKKKAPTASDKAMDKFNKSRSRGIPAPKKRGSKGPSNKDLRDIERGK